MITPVVLKKPSMDKPRLAVREALYNLHSECCEALRKAEGDLEGLMRRRKRGNSRSLKVDDLKKYIVNLTNSATQAWEIASMVMLKDSNTNEYILKQVPPMDAYKFLPRQNAAFMEKLGTYHKLYVGKARSIYGRR